MADGIGEPGAVAPAAEPGAVTEVKFESPEALRTHVNANFKDFVSDEVKADGDVGNSADLDAVFTQWFNSRKMASDKRSVPDDTWSKDQKIAFAKQLGMPDEANGYIMAPPEGAPEQFKYSEDKEKEN